LSLSPSPLPVKVEWTEAPNVPYNTSPSRSWPSLLQSTTTSTSSSFSSLLGISATCNAVVRLLFRRRASSDVSDDKVREPEPLAGWAFSCFLREAERTFRKGKAGLNVAVAHVRVRLGPVQMLLEHMWPFGLLVPPRRALEACTCTIRIRIRNQSTTCCLTGYNILLKVCIVVNLIVLVLVLVLVASSIEGGKVRESLFR
jgi:hypothetical protein